MDRDLTLVVDDASAPRILTEMLDMDLGFDMMVEMTVRVRRRLK